MWQPSHLLPKGHYEGMRTTGVLLVVVAVVVVVVGVSHFFHTNVAVAVAVAAVHLEGEKVLPPSPVGLGGPSRAGGQWTMATTINGGRFLLLVVVFVVVAVVDRHESKWDLGAAQHWCPPRLTPPYHHPHHRPEPRK